jgi:hypothetical protein
MDFILYTACLQKKKLANKIKGLSALYCYQLVAVKNC